MNEKILLLIISITVLIFSYDVNARNNNAGIYGLALTANSPAEVSLTFLDVNTGNTTIIGQKHNGMYFYPYYIFNIFHSTY